MCEQFWAWRVGCSPTSHPVSLRLVLNEFFELGGSGGHLARGLPGPSRRRPREWHTYNHRNNIEECTMNCAQSTHALEYSQVSVFSGEDSRCASSSGERLNTCRLATRISSSRTSISARLRKMASSIASICDVTSCACDSLSSKSDRCVSSCDLSDVSS